MKEINTGSFKQVLLNRTCTRFKKKSDMMIYFASSPLDKTLSQIYNGYCRPHVS